VHAHTSDAATNLLTTLGTCEPRPMAVNHSHTAYSVDTCTGFLLTERKRVCKKFDKHLKVGEDSVPEFSGEIEELYFNPSVKQRDNIVCGISLLSNECYFNLTDS